RPSLNQLFIPFVIENWYYIRLNQDGKIPQCPDGGIYILKRIGDVPTCSLGQAITNGNIHVLP
ncbi:MAG: hypothetical protein WCS42_21710, partial [Verrucomicrobiota bacterium]